MSQDAGQLDAPEARTALADADRVRQAVNGGENRWPTRYLLAFGIAILVLFPLIGLLGPVGVVSFTTGWIVVIAIMVPYATRQRVTRRGQSRRMYVAWGTWAAVYGAALVLGEVFFKGQAAYWIPAAFLVAAPLLVGAWWVSRS
ncbi:MAG: hypothetical protein M3Y17_11130 [Actinomycetota bacterium]|nr:hypothetical protein [Actinomycetota bacterium]